MSVVSDKIVKTVKGFVRSLGDRAIVYYDREPVRVHTAIAGALVAAAAAVSIVVSAPAVLIVVALIVPAIAGSVREVVASPATQRELAAADPHEPSHPEHS